MSIKLTDKEAMVLDQISYAQFTDNINGFNTNYKGKSLQEIIGERCNETNHGNVRGTFV